MDRERSYPLLPPAQPVKRKAPVRAPRRDPAIDLARLSRIARGALTAGALALLIAAATLLLVQQRYAGEVYPAVAAGDIPLGGMSKDGARSVLQAEAAGRESQTVTLSFGDKTWTPTLAELGITIDVDQTLGNAYAVGRGETARTRIGKLTGLLTNDQVVPVVVRFDEAKLNAWFDQVDRELGTEPRDAALDIQGSRVSVLPERVGMQVNRDQAKGMVTAGLQSLSIPGGQLPVMTLEPRVYAGDLQVSQERVAAALSKPITLTYSSKEWTLEPDLMAEFLVQSVHTNDSGESSFTVELDEQALASYLNDLLAPEIDKDAIDATVAWNTKKKTVVAVTKSYKGAKVRPLTLVREVEERFWGDHAPINVPVTVLEPEIDSTRLNALGITTKLAVGDSAFVGSTYDRATNIAVGTELLNGTLVPPHGTFSFNHSIGVISVDKGYIEADVIQGERIGRDVGGGICQVSTTVFRAALLAGLPIVEWWPHEYRLNFYELDGWSPGFDASILQPNDDPFSGGDFRFENPTDSWMLIEAYVEWERVYVIIYGADMGYDVTLDQIEILGPIPPPGEPIEIVVDRYGPGYIAQTEYAQNGWEVSFMQTVKDRNGKVIREEKWQTHFSARPDVWTVSPDMKGQSPGG
jgi:vancomycin resistance protein YoaR